jgi:hypothetical protein
MRWLWTDYNVDFRTSSIVLGQTIRYDIGNVYDPAYTAVAKVRRQWLG